MNDYNRMAGGSRAVKFVLFPLLFLAAAIGFGYVVMLLWNAIIPGLTGWSVITFWKALGLLALCRILFGGMRGGGYSKPGFKKGFRAKWQNMSEEDKTKFRSRWNDRCGWNDSSQERADVTQ